MKTRLVLFVFLMVILASCVPAVTTPPTVTILSPTSMVIPPSHTDTSVPTLDETGLVATPLPTEPLIPDYVLTPNATEVANWQEYQTRLIIAVLSGYDNVFSYPSTFCEWDILGRSGQDVYVWAYCALMNGGSSATPAIIHLDASGSIQSVETLRSGDGGVTADIGEMFPADVREKLIYYSPPGPYMGRPEILRLHLHYRREHPDVPPLNILIATLQP